MKFFFAILLNFQSLIARKNMRRPSEPLFLYVFSRNFSDFSELYSRKVQTLGFQLFQRPRPLVVDQKTISCFYKVGIFRILYWGGTMPRRWSVVGPLAEKVGDFIITQILGCIKFLQLYFFPQPRFLKTWFSSLKFSSNYQGGGIRNIRRLGQHALCSVNLH